jgi:hypothetical protein
VTLCPPRALDPCRLSLQSLSFSSSGNVPVRRLMTTKMNELMMRMRMRMMRMRMRRRRRRRKRRRRRF